MGGSSGRYPFHTIFKDIAGPTGYAKRNVMEGNVSSAFHLIITKKMIEHIKSCTEEEAGRVLKGDWKISTTKLLAFIGILYARGAYEANSLNAFYLWFKEWGPAFFLIQCPEMISCKFFDLSDLIKKRNDLDVYAPTNLQ